MTESEREIDKKENLKKPENFTLKEAVQLLREKGCTIKTHTNFFDEDDVFSPFTRYFFAWPGEEQTTELTSTAIKMIGYHVYQGSRCPPIDDVIEGQFTRIEDSQLLNSGE